MAELALAVAPHGLEMTALHIWSEWNSVCDDLSRGKGQTLGALANSERVHPSVAKFSFLRRNAGTASESVNCESGHGDSEMVAASA